VAVGSIVSCFSLWSTTNCLVAPKSLERLAGFDKASAAMVEKGWPVYRRSTGGGLTPQGPGILNLSVAFQVSPDKSDRIHAAYQRLCDPIMIMLKRVGIETCLASVPGSFCDGPHNIVAAGRKLAGTAQRWRQLAGTTAERRSYAVLAHASILWEPDLSAMVHAVNDFFRTAGCGIGAELDRHTTLANEHLACLSHFASGLKSELRNHFDHDLSSLA
jgi:lipoate-protein ligase A